MILNNWRIVMIRYDQAVEPPGQEDDPNMVAGGNQDPGESSNWGAEDESHPCSENLSIRLKTTLFPGHLVYKAADEAADDVSNEEGASDPGANMEVDLDGVVRDCAVHHLGNGNTGE